MSARGLCIYCQQELPRSPSREHVIPHALTGGFGGSNLTIFCVCPGCNDYFGKALDCVFVEDTVLGPLRYMRGLKADTRRAPRPDVRRVWLKQSGRQVELRPSADGKDYEPFLPTQVGFLVRQAPAPSYRYFTLDRLDEALSDPELDHTCIHIVGQRQGFEQEAIAALESRGRSVRHDSNFHCLLPLGPDGTPSGEVEIEHRTLVDRVIRHCMAKIAFNYLAYVTCRGLGNADWLSHADFNGIRDFIRRDASDSPRFRTRFGIHVQGGPQHDGYVAAVSWSRGAVVGTVSLFSAFAWQVELAHSFSGIVWDLRSCHFWDLTEKTVERPTTRFWTR